MFRILGEKVLGGSFWLKVLEVIKELIRKVSEEVYWVL